MKSEPTTYSIDHLFAKPNRTDHWEGVRNYQARNFMRDNMRIGDQAFFYHSNCQVPAIVGRMEIVKESHPDFTAFDPDSKYYDPKSNAMQPRWFMVSVKAVEKFLPPLPLAELKMYPPLHNMILLKPGNRLSVTPLTHQEWHFILALYNQKAKTDLNDYRKT